MAFWSGAARGQKVSMSKIHLLVWLVISNVVICANVHYARVSIGTPIDTRAWREALCANVIFTLAHSHMRECSLCANVNRHLRMAIWSMRESYWHSRMVIRSMRECIDTRAWSFVFYARMSIDTRAWSFGLCVNCIDTRVWSFDLCANCIDTRAWSIRSMRECVIMTLITSVYIPLYIATAISKLCRLLLSDGPSSIHGHSI